MAVSKDIRSNVEGYLVADKCLNEGTTGDFFPLHKLRSTFATCIAYCIVKESNHCEEAEVAILVLRKAMSPADHRCIMMHQNPRSLCAWDDISQEDAGAHHGAAWCSTYKTHGRIDGVLAMIIVIAFVVIIMIIIIIITTTIITTTTTIIIIAYSSPSPHQS